MSLGRAARRWPWRLLLALAALSAAPATTPAAFAQPISDARRLQGGLPPRFQRPLVQIYPLLDQRLLSLKGDEAGQIQPEPPPEAWARFLEALPRAINLNVTAPQATARRLAQRGQRGIEIAQRTLKAAYLDYKEVRLEAALPRFEAAIAGLLAWRYDAVAPAALAHALLTLGLAAREAQHPEAARRAFERALQMDPAIRLRAGYDHPEAVAAFEDARARLLTAPPRPERFNLAEVGEGFTLRARALPDRLEIAIQSPSGVQLIEQPFSDDPEDDASRLASRVYACLPFGRAPKAPRHRRRLYLDGGFSALGFLKSPVGPLYSMGAGMGLMWNLAPNVGLSASAALTNSGRDEAEDLRADIPTLALFFGPGVYHRGTRLRLSGQLGGALTIMGEVERTTNAACKYFSAEDAIPKALCDPEIDIEQIPMGLSTGAALQLEAALRVVDEIYLTGRLSAAAFIFESQDNGLDYPALAYFGLGYRLF
ncbi:hypothetical protein KJ940_21005 [Myxococcota bacterium]|nr:hypothetical protein [Myxococcota bacterium]